MCNALSLKTNVQLAVKNVFKNVQINAPNFAPCYHMVAQAHQPWPVFTSSQQIQLLQWGLIASYMNSPEKIKQYRASMVNARSEKLLHDDKSVWHQLQNQRCIIVATGFFEYKQVNNKKTPYYISVMDNDVLLIAGLYNQNTFSLVTRKANSLMATIHNSGPHAGRMPLMLPPSAALDWLNPQTNNLDALCNYEFGSNQLQAWPINKITQQSPNNSSLLLPIPEQGSLF
jgi:putative SOS response-associated peptidase YedK